MIQIQNLKKVFTYYKPRKSIRSWFFPEKKEITALNNVSIKIKTGEIYGLLGPNGAGKTSLMKIICGLLKPTAGVVLVNDKEVFAAQREIGLMLGDSMVYALMTGRDNLEYTASLYGVSDTEGRIQTLADFFEIGDWLDRYVSDYSLGMRIKLCLARALVHDPPILLLDEPTLGLDPHYSLFIRERIKHLKKTIVLTTHYMDEADYLSDRIGILHHGHLLTEGTPNDLRSQIGSSKSTSLSEVFVEITRDP